MVSLEEEIVYTIHQRQVQASEKCQWFGREHLRWPYHLLRHEVVHSGLL